ncbi:MAG: hypothetical protein N4A62_04560 [Marinisporobacter sp.]|jgi:hypothetical protein|nr:hypothetical protein [Marinisporobacter sp.]
MGDYILFTIGIIIVIIAIVIVQKNTSTKTMGEFEDSQNKEMLLLENIDFAENLIRELKEISEDTIKTLDTKTNDIYKMIQILDEKMKEYSMNLNQKENERNNESFVAFSHKRESYNIKEENPTSHQDNDKKKILQLYNQGYTPSQIAKKLDKGIGEVQLICSLKKR